MKLKLKIVITTSIILLVLCGGVACYIYTLYVQPNFSTKNGKNVSIYIDENTDYNELIAQITLNSTQKFANSFQRIANWKDFDQSYRVGHYVLEDGMSNRVLLNRLSGGMQSPVVLKFNNIRTLPQLMSRLDLQLQLDSADLANVFDDAERVSALGFNQQTLISMFIPNSYEVYWDMSAEELVEKMKKEYDKFWNAKDRRAKAEQMGMTLQEVSTLASIVEGETNKAAEKPIVAGLYINRLKKNIPLQADPTVKFAVGDFSLTQILYEHLEVESPYNTYKHTGLPPGPIAMPSIQGIDAVLNHAKHNYIYMCAKETLDGTHNFATSLSQHNANAARYHRALREWQRKNGK